MSTNPFRRCTRPLIRQASHAARLRFGLASLAGALLAPLTAQAQDNGAANGMPGEVLLVLRQADALPGLLTRHRLSLASRFGQRPIYRLQVVGGQTVDAAITALQAEPAVLVAEPNLRRQAPEGVKNNVWAVGRAADVGSQWAGPALQATAARAMAQGKGVRVAVLDTGFDLRHPALTGRWLPGRDFVDGDDDPSETAQPDQNGYGHGTHVAGLVAWMAPAVRLMPLRVLDNEGQGNAWVLAEALLYALDPDGNPATDDGAQVINLSLAGWGRTRLMATVQALAECETPDAGDPDVDLSDRGYDGDRNRCKRNAGKGTVVVAAAGNDGEASRRAYPAAESAYGLLAVAASVPGGRLASFSNRGGWVHLAAPGEAVYSTVPGGGYAAWSGTSMAAALVAGTAALVRGNHPTLEPKDVARCLERSAADVSGSRIPLIRPADALTKLARGPRNCR